MYKIIENDKGIYVCVPSRTQTGTPKTVRVRVDEIRGISDHATFPMKVDGEILITTEKETLGGLKNTDGTYIVAPFEKEVKKVIFIASE